MVVVHHKFKTVLLTANRKQIFNINISFFQYWLMMGIYLLPLESRLYFFKYKLVNK